MSTFIYVLELIGIVVVILYLRSKKKAEDAEMRRQLSYGKVPCPAKVYREYYNDAFYKICKGEVKLERPDGKEPDYMDHQRQAWRMAREAAERDGWRAY